MSQIRLQVVVPFYQPLEQSPSGLENFCDQIIEPLLDMLKENPRIALAIHGSGPVLEYLSKERAHVLSNIKELCDQGQIEVLGGLFYGGCSAWWPEMDLRGQIQMMSEYWDSAVGKIPVGFWLHEMAWCHELPRLLDQTGLAFGYLHSRQVRSPNPLLTAGYLERGGNTLGTFILDQQASEAMWHTNPENWVQTLNPQGPQLRTLWLPLGSRVVSHIDTAWLKTWMNALAQKQDHLSTILPSAAWSQLITKASFYLSQPLSPELFHATALAQVQESAQILHLFPEARWLHQRTLRASDKLREAITTMEEEHLEESWSDVLATAQRLVFAAQAQSLLSIDGEVACHKIAIRDAVIQRLCSAETMMDELVQGDDNWLAVEEEDRDLDGQDEIWVTNRNMSVCLSPNTLSTIRSWESKIAERNILDIGGHACGIREWLFTNHEEAFTVLSPEYMGQPVAESTETNSQVEEEGDGLFTLTHTLNFLNTTSQTVAAVLRKSLQIPVEKAQCSISYQSPTSLTSPKLGIEIPLRLDDQNAEVLVNQTIVSAAQTFSGVHELSVRGKMIEVHIVFGKAVELLMNNFKQLDQRRQGYLFLALVPWTELQLENAFSMQISLFDKKS